MPDLWESMHGLDRDNPADAAFDPERDQLSNLGEYLAATDPNDSTSTLLLHSPRMESEAFTFRGQSVTGRVYRVEAFVLSAAVGCLEIFVVSGTGDELEFRPPTAPAIGQLFRVRLE